MTTTEHYHCTYTNSYAVAYPGGVLWVLQHPPCATASTYKLGLVCYIRNTNQRLLRAVTVPHSLRVRERAERERYASQPEAKENCPRQLIIIILLRMRVCACCKWAPPNENPRNATVIIHGKVCPKRPKTIHKRKIYNTRAMRG